jgi:hypothetical protein
MSQKSNRSGRLFDALKALQQRDHEAAKQIVAEDKLSPYLLMKWMATASDDQLQRVDLIANKFMFSLAEHPDMLIDILSCCSARKTARYNWVKRPKAATVSDVEDVFIRYYGPHVNLDDAKSAHTEEQFEQICHQLGMQDREIALLVKRY